MRMKNAIVLVALVLLVLTSAACTQGTLVGVRETMRTMAPPPPELLEERSDLEDQILDIVITEEKGLSVQSSIGDSRSGGGISESGHGSEGLFAWATTLVTGVADSVKYWLGARDPANVTIMTTGDATIAEE